MVKTAGELLLKVTQADGASPGLCCRLKVGSDQDNINVRPLRLPTRTGGARPGQGEAFIFTKNWRELEKLS